MRERWPRDGILRVEIQRNSSRASVFLQYYDSAGIQEELEAEEGGGGAGVVGLSLAALQEEEEDEEEMTLEMFDNSSVQVSREVARCEQESARGCVCDSSPTDSRPVYLAVFVFWCVTLAQELKVASKLEPSAKQQESGTNKKMFKTACHRTQRLHTRQDRLHHASSQQHTVIGCGAGGERAAAAGDEESEREKEDEKRDFMV